MKKRILGGAIVVLILSAALYFGGLATVILFPAMSLAAVSELDRALRQKGHKLFTVTLALCAAAWYAFLALRPIVMPETAIAPGLIALTGLLFTVTAVLTAALYPRRTVPDAAFTLFGFVYAVLSLSAVFVIRQRENGLLYSIFVFVLAWSSDIFAYLFGSLFGKKKVFPELSPHKTRIGVIGAMLGTAAASVAFGLLTRSLWGLSTGGCIALTAAAGLVGSVLAQAGDLLASAVKRYAGIKDFGNLIPGHGGILDRFDSVLLVAPAVELLLCIMEAIK